MAKKDTSKRKSLVAESKRVYIPQSKIPKMSLEEALKLSQGLHDNFAGKPTTPHQLAVAVDISPTSSNWQDICGASIAYGLTLGGYNAATISLSELGSRIVAPTTEGDDIVAKVEASLRPEIARQFFEHYNKAKFPQDKIAKNVLAQMGVPAERLDSVLEILKQNGQFVGIIHQTKNGPYVAIDTPKPSEAAPPAEEQEQLPDELAEQKGESVPALTSPQTQTRLNQRVFITHGKNKEIVAQLKDLLTFGRFIPVVAEEHETPSKPVSDKVLDDMRSCFAGIIHVASEDELLDKAGTVHHKINENVLIEIGAAMALYGRNFILLVQKGIHLPSNLQGLYLCYYEGNRLDYDATMKLLKAFNEFK
ncbi:TIR domain-containing protein [Ignavibacteria bacterium 4148-Me]|uniref:TIR domain-containing protein n=1 Tax=Rosettibacter primus TaxID=3111523 RepID=UPI00336BDA59